MPPKIDQDRFVPPVMHAFRAAFRERDAAEHVDQKTDSGERVIAARRASPRSAISEHVLRRELAEDLTSLLNTVNLASAEDLGDLEYVKKSILNFGIGDLTTISSDSHAVDRLPAGILALLKTFEPRLIPETVSVSREYVRDDASGLVKFHIKADMHATPVDVAVEFVADVEAGTGKTRLSRL